MEEIEYHLQQATRLEKKAVRYAKKGKKAQSYLMSYLASQHRHTIKENEEK